MAMWGAVILLALAGTTVLADPSLTFPEVARGPSRIVSGWEAQEGQFPHQLSLRMVNPAGGVSSCGGTIIHAEWGLTAAHCTATRVTLVIRAGTVNLTQPSAIFETSKYYNHPMYNEALQSIVQPNDIGLIEFGRKLIFSVTVQPIRIQRSEAREENYAGAQSIASGWGRTWTNGASPENLNWVFLTITSNLDCRVAYGDSSIIQPSTICARGYNVTSQSTCQGDSGGPLTTIDIDGAVTQVGVTSFVSSTGCHTDFPAGFIRPGFYHDWFTEVTGIDFDWQYVNATEGPEITTSEVETTEPVPETTSALEVETTEPEQETTSVPEELTTEPEQETTSAPEELTTVPEQETTSAPEVLTTEPEQETTSAPEELTTEPEKETTSAPEELTTEPEQETTSVPEELTTEPEQETTSAPEELTTVPEQETTSAPEELTTEPEQETTSAPEELTTEPEQETTSAPEELTTEPEQETTSAPEELTTEPEQETTSGPEELTTEPEQETTSAPEELTTEPEQETTSAPEELTTVASEESDDSSSSSSSESSSSSSSSSESSSSSSSSSESSSSSSSSSESSSSSSSSSESSSSSSSSSESSSSSSSSESSD